MAKFTINTDTFYNGKKYRKGDLIELKDKVEITKLINNNIIIDSLPEDKNLLKAKESNLKLEATLQEKDAQIKKLEAELLEKNAEIKKLVADLQETAVEIGKLKDELSDCTGTKKQIKPA